MADTWTMELRAPAEAMQSGDWASSLAHKIGAAFDYALTEPAAAAHAAGCGLAVWGPEVKPVDGQPQVQLTWGMRLAYVAPAGRLLQFPDHAAYQAWMDRGCPL